MAGKIRKVGRRIEDIHRSGFKKIDRVRRGKSLLGELGVKDKKRKPQQPQDVIGYDGTNFTRNGQKTTRDSLRMG
jgi:hypothetical protein